MLDRHESARSQIHSDSCSLSHTLKRSNERLSRVFGTVILTMSTLPFGQKYTLTTYTASVYLLVHLLSHSNAFTDAAAAVMLCIGEHEKSSVVQM